MSHSYCRFNNKSLRNLFDLKKMFITKFITLLSCAGFFHGVNAELEVYMEDVIIEEYSPLYVRDPSAYISDDSENEYAMVVNFTLIDVFPKTAIGHFELTGASMGEFVLPMGFNYEMELCDMLDEPVLTGPFFAALGFDEDDCPPSPGVYGTAGYHIETENLPDEILPNKYKVNFDISDGDIKLLGLVFIVDVQ